MSIAGYSEDSFGFIGGANRPAVSIAAPSEHNRLDEDSMDRSIMAESFSAYFSLPSVLLAEQRSLVALEEANGNKRQSTKELRQPPISENQGLRKPPRKNDQRRTKIMLIMFLLFSIVVASIAVVVYGIFYGQNGLSRHDQQPSIETSVPSTKPVSGPTFRPVPMDETQFPTTHPVNLITDDPTASPTEPTTNSPTSSPTMTPTGFPTSFPSATPSSVPTLTPTLSRETILEVFLRTMYGVSFPDDPEAPENTAIYYLAQELDNIVEDLEDGDRILQRYALFVISLSLGLTDETSFGGNETLTLPEDGNTFGQMYVDECEDWTGVVCVNETVTKLSLGSQQHVGSIPSAIGYLSNLVELDLSQNQFFGTIPDSLYELSFLEKLYLYQNNLTGSLSERVGNLQRLTHLHLSHNELTGSLPFSMMNTILLSVGDETLPPQVEKPYYYINLYSNSFSGTIPSGLGWSKLWYLDLGRNQFTGPLPHDMDAMVSLRHLFLDHNNFNATIPDSIPRVGNSSLQALAIDNNQLTGEFPSEWEYTDQIVSLTVANNNLTKRFKRKFCDEMDFMNGGGMVEFTADCDVCNCKATFCQECSR